MAPGCAECAYPAVSDLLLSAEDDVIGHIALPRESRTRTTSTNPLERENKEIKRGLTRWASARTAPPHWTGRAMLVEQHDKWALGRRYVGDESMSQVFSWPPERGSVTALLPPVKY